jgi:LysM repeat protein
VREGDTLSTIANRFGITVGSVCRINVMPRDTVLAIGQELIVYTTPERVPPELRGRIEAEPEVAASTEAPVPPEARSTDEAPGEPSPAPSDAGLLPAPPDAAPPEAASLEDALEASEPEAPAS